MGRDSTPMQGGYELPDGTGGFAELLAGVLFIVYALPAGLDMGAFARPGISAQGALFLVPPFVCLAVDALGRIGRHGLGSPLGWCAVARLVGAVLVTLSTLLLGLAALPPAAAQVGIYTFVLGGVCTGTGIVATGLLFVAAPPRSSGVGTILVGWPVLGLVALGLFVWFDVGTVVAAAAAPVGLALVVGGATRVVHQRRAPGSRPGSRRRVETELVRGP